MYMCKLQDKLPDPICRKCSSDDQRSAHGSPVFMRVFPQSEGKLSEAIRHVQYTLLLKHTELVESKAVSREESAGQSAKDETQRKVWFSDSPVMQHDPA
ncbi:hypothetical protein Q8A73_013288 [Channa argus]|nr:hypothetical protein Q8A73_013288 [Channa argus]